MIWGWIVENLLKKILDPHVLLWIVVIGAIGVGWYKWHSLVSDNAELKKSNSELTVKVASNEKLISDVQDKLKEQVGIQQTNAATIAQQQAQLSNLRAKLAGMDLVNKAKANPVETAAVVEKDYNDRLVCIEQLTSKFSGVTVEENQNCN